MSNLIGKSLREYEILDEVGLGSFGTVYRTYQEAIDREVAIKVILPKHADDKDFPQPVRILLPSARKGIGGSGNRINFF